MIYRSHSGPLIFLFIVLFLGLFYLVAIGAVTLAFAKIGIRPQYLLSLFFLILIGSAVNIPIKELENEELSLDRVISFYGFRYRLPTVQRQTKTILAVNLGGAVIPTLISLYVLINCQVPIRAIIATAIISAVVYKLARPVKGLGIGVPMFVPPLLAALTALILTPEHSPPVAYIAGTLGTLIGADLLNLNKVRGLGAPVAAIGGAGTFDGIFLTGIIAALLA
jgi:uncharacterized membrane protein